MKSKTKSAKRLKKEKSYPAHYLAIALGAVILIEAVILGATTPNAWEEALKVLDLSAGVQVVMADTYTVIEPMLVQIDNVRTFYELAATEMILLLDASDTDLMMFPKGVVEFYELASIEMEKMLDFSDQISYWPKVAGASISK